MASKPSKKEKHPLDRVPMRKLASGLRKRLLMDLRDKNPDLKIGKLRKD
jgi:hypothetical protein